MFWDHTIPLRGLLDSCHVSYLLSRGFCGTSRRVAVPFSYEALPTTFYLGLVERVDVNLFLYVEIEAEHGSIGGETMSRDLTGGEG